MEEKINQNSKRALEGIVKQMKDSSKVALVLLEFACAAEGVYSGATGHPIKGGIDSLFASSLLSSIFCKLGETRKEKRLIGFYYEFYGMATFGTGYLLGSMWR
jgi:hypothetical protein